MSKDTGPIRIVSQERRREILAMQPTTAVHSDLYDRMPFAGVVEVVPAVTNAARATATLPSGAIRVLAWNAARCTDVDSFARFIGAARADIVLLTEMDWGMARSGQIRTAQELATRLSLGYAFAVEFLELGLGDEREKAAHAGTVNEVGYHGAAILSSRPVSDARRIPLETSGGWFDGARGQRRVGGRMALSLVAAVGGNEIVFCSLHLESESEPSERAREMRVLFDELDAAYPGRPVVIGGDLNTFSVSKTELDDPAALRARAKEDPVRFADPVRYEPLFALAEERGYEWKLSNVPGTPTHHEQESPTRTGTMKLDWFLTRGVQVRTPSILPALDDVAKARLSDHDAIIVTVAGPSLEGGRVTT